MRHVLFADGTVKLLEDKQLENMSIVYLKDNDYFLLGDNFYNSYDSRQFGFVHFDQIKGKLIYILN